MPHGRTRRPLCQPPVKGGRTPVNSAFLNEVEHAVQKEMRRWGVSRSYVIATAVAFALNVEEQPDYKKDKGIRPQLRAV